MRKRQSTTISHDVSSITLSVDLEQACYDENHETTRKTKKEDQISASVDALATVGALLLLWLLLLLHCVSVPPETNSTVTIMKQRERQRKRPAAVVAAVTPIAVAVVAISGRPYLCIGVLQPGIRQLTSCCLLQQLFCGLSELQLGLIEMRCQLLAL